ENLYFQGA
nr:Chain C, PEPTIDE [synthetic construct]